jgi:hypothetical protein
MLPDQAGEPKGEEKSYGSDLMSILAAIYNKLETGDRDLLRDGAETSDWDDTMWQASAF